MKISVKEKLSSMELRPIIFTLIVLSFIAGVIIGVLLVDLGVSAAPVNEKPTPTQLKVGTPISGLSEPSDIQPAGGIYEYQRTQNPQ